jgi:hypothetical protein
MLRLSGPGGHDETDQKGSWGRGVVELVMTGTLLAAATAGGPLLLAIAENGNASLSTLVLYVAVPAAALVALLGAASAKLGYHSLYRAIWAGTAFGAVGSLGLELVRNIGFYAFNAMPGQLPELMGVLITNRVMLGPDLLSNIVGWTDHFWNGAMFGLTYVLLVGGAPRNRSHWYGAGAGAAFGLLVGTGFLLSPVSRATGAGIFGSVIGAKYVVVVYLAHSLFGAVLGFLVHRYAQRTTPLWHLLCRAVPFKALVRA